MLDDIRRRARGRWYDILNQAGIDRRYLINKHGPCPMCGGKDRFRWDNKNGEGSFFCSRCGAGDGVGFVMMLQKVDFKEALKFVEGAIGSARVFESPEKKSDAKCREDMERKWKSAVALSGPAALYLEHRIGIIPTSKVLRSLARPSMLALMQAPDGRATMIHETLLTPQGWIAKVSKPKLMMRGTIVRGSAVRLCEFSDVLGIAEGIETALSATELTGIPCWAALNEVLLRNWSWPQVGKIVIFGDNDLNYVGQSAAYDLAKKIALGGKVDVEVSIPDEPGADWNDVLCKQNVDNRASVISNSNGAIEMSQ